MTVSGSTNYTLNTNQIVNEALELLGIPIRSQVVEDINSSKRTLNLMIKNMRGKFPMIWKSEWYTFPFTQSNYVIGDDSNCYECIRNHTSTSSDEPVSGTNYMSYWVLRYSEWVDTTGYVVGDIIVGSDNLLYECALAHTSSTSTKPITGGSYTTYWSLYSSVTPTDWATGQGYASITNIDIDDDVIGLGQMFIRESANNDRGLTEMITEEYFNLGDKTLKGKPTQIYYRRRITGNSIFVYPFPDSSTDYVLNVELLKMPDDFDTAANTPDFLQEWLQPLTLNLAVLLAPKFGISGTDYKILKSQARESLQNAEAIDTEFGNMKFQPNF